MKVRVDWNKEPLEVYLISWPTVRRQVLAGDDKTQFMIREGDCLNPVWEDECTLISPELNDFVFLPFDWDGGRTKGLMWRPLAEADIWEPLIERFPEGRNAFAELRRKFPYT